MAERRFPNYSLEQRFENSDIKLTRREKLALRRKNPVSHLPQEEKADFIQKVTELDKRYPNISQSDAGIGIHSPTLHKIAHQRLLSYRNYLLFKHFPRNNDEAMMSLMFYTHATQTPPIPLPPICTVTDERERVYDTEKIEDIKRYWRDCIDWHKTNQYNLTITQLVEEALDLEG